MTKTVSVRTMGRGNGYKVTNNHMVVKKASA